jgi:hypothetical protein
MLTAQEISENRLEMREFNHRMTNVPATLQAIFRRGFSQSRDQCIRRAMTQQGAAGRQRVTQQLSGLRLPLGKPEYSCANLSRLETLSAGRIISPSEV